MSVDPANPRYPFMSPYCFSANNPIRYVDSEGKGPVDGMLLKIGANIITGIGGPKTFSGNLTQNVLENVNSYTLNHATLISKSTALEQISVSGSRNDGVHVLSLLNGGAGSIESVQQVATLKSIPGSPQLAVLELQSELTTIKLGGKDNTEVVGITKQTITQKQVLLLEQQPDGSYAGIADIVGESTIKSKVQTLTSEQLGKAEKAEVQTAVKNNKELALRKKVVETMQKVEEFKRAVDKQGAQPGDKYREDPKNMIRENR